MSESLHQTVPSANPKENVGLRVSSHARRDAKLDRRVARLARAGAKLEARHAKLGATARGEAALSELVLAPSSAPASASPLN